MSKNKVIIFVVIAAVIGLVIGYIVGNVTPKVITANVPKKSTIIGDNDKTEENIDKGQSKQPTAINLGEKITNSNIEMTFKSVSFKNEIKWRTSQYSTMSASIGEGKVGLSISGTFKNLMGNAIDTGSIIGKVIVDDKYTYDLSFKPHISGYKVDPLEKKDYDFYASVPKELKNTYKKAEFIFGYNNDFKTVSTQYINGQMVDKYESLENIYSLTVTK